MDDNFFKSFPSFGERREHWFRILGEKRREGVYALDEEKFLNSRLAILRGCGANDVDVTVLYTLLKGAEEIAVRGGGFFSFFFSFFFPDAIQDTPLAQDLFPKVSAPARAPAPERQRDSDDDDDDDDDDDEDVKPKSSRKKRSGEVKQFACSNGYLLSLLSTMLVSRDAVASLLSGEELDHESGLPRSLHNVAVHWAPVDANNSTPCLECDVRNVTFRVSYGNGTDFGTGIGTGPELALLTFSDFF